MKSALYIAGECRAIPLALFLLVTLTLVCGPLYAQEAASLSSAELERRIASMLSRQGGTGWKGIPPQRVAQEIGIRMAREDDASTLRKGGARTAEGWDFWVYSEFRNGGYQTRFDTYIDDPVSDCTFPVEQFARKLKLVGLTGVPVRGGLLPETWYISGRNVELAIRTYTSTADGRRQQCVETISIGPPEF